MTSLFEELARDREKFLAFLQYLIQTGRITEEEIIDVMDRCEEYLNKIKDE